MAALAAFALLACNPREAAPPEPALDSTAGVEARVGKKASSPEPTPTTESPETAKAAADGEPHAGWIPATDHAVEPGSKSAARACPQAPTSAPGCIEVEAVNGVIALHGAALLPVKAGKTYRLRMRYRIDKVGDDPRGRLVLAAQYHDAEGNPILQRVCTGDVRTVCDSDAECPSRGYCRKRVTPFEQIATMYSPSESRVWHNSETTITPGSYRDASRWDPARPEKNTDFERKEAAFVRLRISTNRFFEGKMSVEDIALLPIEHAELGTLPEGSVAYDITANVCDGGPSDGERCSGDADCGGSRCGRATPGFEPLPIGSERSDSQACGFTSSKYSSNEGGHYPTTLLGQRAGKPQLACQLEPHRDYTLSLYMGGYWRNDPRPETHTVTLNDDRVPAIDETRVCQGGGREGSGCREDADCGEGVCRKRDLYEEIYFARVHATLVDREAVDNKGYAIYDDYIWPRRYRRHDVAVRTDAAGLVRIQVASGFVSGLVLIPQDTSNQDPSPLDAFDAAMRDEFVSQWAEYREPDKLGLPVVSGDYAPATADEQRGYVVFRRHWMEFVELSSRPEGPDVIHTPSPSDLRVTATPGEYEPVTFSIWPLRDLEDVTLEVSPLQAASGATIPADAVETWYLQQRPQRLQPPTSFGFASGFLPDWQQRDLFADITQRAWLNIRVPEATPPGTYRGTVTFTPRNAEAIALGFEVEVLPFSLVRPQRTHVFRLSPGNSLVMGPDKEMHRRAAIRDLVSHGFLPEVSIWWPTHLLDANGETRRDAQGRISINWDRGNLVGTPDAQISAILELGTDRRVWLDDGGIMRFGLLDAFGAGGSSGWSIQDTEDWLQALEEKLGPNGYGFEAIYIHVTGEESHYEGAKYRAWLAFMAFVSENRSAEKWPHVWTTHSFNTEPGQREALAQGGVDLPALGMFHGIGSDAVDQIQQAQQAGKPFLFYGLRGRLVPGFYLWKAGGSGSFHEWYTRYEGASNNDWDNPIAFDHAGHAGTLLHEGPGWDNVHYSPTGEVVGSWLWEEIREGVDDDAYMTTLEHWIEATRGDARPAVVTARRQAQETLEDIRSQINLRNTGRHSVEEEEASPGMYTRLGLTLVRPWADHATAFDRIRRQASRATAALVRAHAGPGEATSPSRQEASQQRQENTQTKP